jgi:hypothetical protein
MNLISGTQVLALGLEMVSAWEVHDQEVERD